MSRGIERRSIVRDDADRLKRLDWLRRTVEMYGWRLHAFVLMNNHDHLFVQTPEANLSAGMQLLNGSYSSYFNHRHRRAGHLFQGRYKGHLIEEEGYYLEVSRYIHLNPVRAGMVQRPDQWRWSSFSGYQRARCMLDWITYEDVLREFSRDALSARRAYGRFVAAGLRERLKSPFARARAGLLVGSETFVARVRKLLDDKPDSPELPQLRKLRPRPSPEAIISVVCDHFGVDQSAWTPGKRVDDASRSMAAYLARRRFGYAAGEIARALGYRSHGSVNTAVRRVESAANLSRTAARLEKRLR
jgi:REP element-mobilizing transposase RayT